MPSPHTPLKSIFNQKNAGSQNNLIKLIKGGATPRTLGLVNNTRLHTVNSPRTVASRGPGGAPMKRSNGRRAPINMTEGQTKKAIRGLFNAANAFVN